MNLIYRNKYANSVYISKIIFIIVLIEYKLKRQLPLFPEEKILFQVINSTLLKQYYSMHYS